MRILACLLGAALAWPAARCMGKLIYSMLMALDGYVEDQHGRFGWGAPEDEEVRSYINQLAPSVGEGKSSFP